MTEKTQPMYIPLIPLGSPTPPDVRARPSSPLATTLDLTRQLDDLRRDAVALLRRVESISQQQREHHEELHDHDNRLDDHDRKHASASTALSDLRSILNRTSMEVHRHTDLLTVHGLTSERLERKMDKTLELLDLLRNLMQPRAVL